MALKTAASILVNRTASLVPTTRKSFNSSSSTSELQNILSKFPSKNLSFAFAYGSGVKKQLSYDYNNEQPCPIKMSTSSHCQQQQKQPPTMIDVMFCVKNPLDWHTENIKINPNHYSGLGQQFGPKWISKIQEKFGAKVYCNTLIDLSGNGVNNSTVGGSGGDGPVIKYGVITEKHLMDDLLNWSYLYVAGRLQKPVDILKIPPMASQQPSSSIDSRYCIQEAINRNLCSAIHAALLLLPEQFSTYQLFYTIANLSYAGDFRMIFGEKKDKVKNIVTPQLAQFWAYYSSALKIFESLHCISSSVPLLRNDGVQLKNTLAASAAGVEGIIINQNKSQEMVYHHLKNLPKTVRNRLVKSVNKTTTSTLVKSDAEEDQILKEMAQKYTSTQLAIRLDQEIRATVWNSSVYQSIKNIPTAGITKSVQYSYRKILKTFNM